MTVSSTTATISYTANGTQTAFTVPFYFLANGDLVVETISSGVPTVKTITTDYTVSGAGDADGGTVTFLTAPTSGLTVRITRFVSPTQLVDYVANDPFPAETHEQALDRLTMIVQHLMLRTGGVTYDSGLLTGALYRSATDTTVWDLEGARLTNGVAASASTDVPILSQVQSLISTSTGNLPTPTDPGQDDHILVASSGAWVVTAPAAVRTALGLGTAAVQDTGTSVGDVVAVQASTELPALGGANLTGRVAVATRLYEYDNFI